MTRREKQYTDWKKFWHKRDQIKLVRNQETGTITLVGGRIRVPDTMLKKMGLDKKGKPLHPVENIIIGSWEKSQCQ